MYSFRRFRVDCRKNRLYKYILRWREWARCVWYSFDWPLCAHHTKPVPPEIRCLPCISLKKSLLHRGTNENAKTLTINCIKTIYEFLLPKRSKSNFFFASESIHSVILLFYISICTNHFLIVLKLYFLWKEICLLLLSYIWYEPALQQCKLHLKLKHSA